MAFARENHLTLQQIQDALACLARGGSVAVDRIRYRNKNEIRHTTMMTTEELREFILSSFEDGHQPGGDLEVAIPEINCVLFGHHDGVYWLQPITDPNNGA